MFNRVEEIDKEIEDTIEKYRCIIGTLQKELKEIRRQCQHSNKEVVRAGYGACDYKCNDCGSTWGD